MKYLTLLLIIIAILAFSCKNKSKPYSEQLSNYFEKKVKNFDSALTMNSFELIQLDSITGRFGLMIEDTFYYFMRQRIQDQLILAKSRNRLDSVEFFQGEIDYVTTEMDSIRKLISLTTDTVRKYGLMAETGYELSKNNLTAKDTAYFFIDLKGNVINANMLDNFIERTAQRLK